MRLADSPEGAAVEAAALVAGRLREAVAERGLATVALSGGRTPGRMVELLAGLEVPWAAVHLFQVDERVAPSGDAARNWPLLAPIATLVPGDHAHSMPVDQPDGDVRYAATLAGVCGTQAVLDVVQLGLGGDGHTASLPPGDPVTQVDDLDVAWSGEYAGYRRLTLTLPVLNRARSVVWLVTGGDKADVVRRLIAGDPSVVGTRVTNDNQVLVVDADAGRDLPRE